MKPTSAAPVPEPQLTLRVRCPEDLIAVAPLLMGFQPEDSVVMITSDADRQFHARVGLPPRTAPPGWWREVAETLLGPATRNGVRSLALLFYSEDESVVRRVWGALRQRSERSGIRVLEALRVDGRRYYPLLAGQHLREVGIGYDVSAHPFAAQAVLHGIVVERDRDALVATAAPDPTARAAVEDALSATVQVEEGPPATDPERLVWGEWVREVVSGHLDAGTRLTDEEVARATWVMQDVRVRDAAWALMSRTDARRHQELWLDVLRRTPDRLAAAPAALFGWAAWLVGNGALAWVAVDRCQEVDPDYGLALLLADALSKAVPPELGEPDKEWDLGLVS